MTYSSDGTRVVRVGVKPATPGEPGLPKPAVEVGRITRAGLAGDWNRYRQEKRNGDPDMAVLLMPIEVLRDLNAEGWPVRPGDLGENLSVEGLPPDRLRPGLQLRTGEALIEVTKPCEPCSNLAFLPYVGRERLTDFMRDLMGRRGWYARVIEEGEVRPGDACRDSTGPDAHPAPPAGR